MSFASPDARLSIDWDADGAFAVLTRSGQPAEIVRLPDIHRVATEAMQAELAMRGRVVVTPSRGMTLGLGEGHSEEGPEPLIGQWGE